MRAPLHALVVGSADDLAVGDRVRARLWTSIDVVLDGRDLPQPALGVLAHRAVPDTTPLLDEDLLVFRGPFATAAVCTACAAADLDEDVLLAHEAATGHAWRRPHEAMVRGLVESILVDAGRLRGRGIAMELDVDPWAEGCPWPADLRSPAELDLQAMLLRVADVVVAGSTQAVTAARRVGARDVALVDPRSPTAAEDRAAAWRRAADHGGTGLLVAAGAEPGMVLEAVARAGRRLAHRLAIRAADDRAAVELADRREATAVGRGGAEARRPLVSVVVPLLDEGGHLAERAVRSALASDEALVEVLVVGDDASGAREAVAAAADPRARWIRTAAIDGSQRHPVIDGQAGAIEARANVLSAGLAAAGGSWRLVLRPDAILTPTALATLLDASIANGLEVAYGRVMLVRDGELAGMAGAWPPSPAAIPAEAALVAAALGAVLVDPEAWIEGEDPVGNLWRRYLALGVRVGALDDVVAVRELVSVIPAGSAA